MAGFWGDGIWGEEYSNPDYWQGTKKDAPKHEPKDSGGDYWSPIFWANEYWGDQYWLNPRIHAEEFSIEIPKPKGGDDVPYEYRRPKKAKTKVRAKKKKKVFVPDYAAILQDIRRADDEESAMLLL